MPSLGEQIDWMNKAADVAHANSQTNVDEFQAGAQYGREVTLRCVAGMLEADLQTNPLLRFEDCG